MRNGRLLTEASPSDLLAFHGLPTLEDVFLKLCLDMDGVGDGSSTGTEGERQPPGFLAAQRAKNRQEPVVQQQQQPDFSEHGSRRPYRVYITLKKRTDLFTYPVDVSSLENGPFQSRFRTLIQSERGRREALQWCPT